MTVTLILGGARSGKSRYAQRLARRLSEQPVYVATSRRWDDDHAARIARHQQDRGPEWQTIEAEKHLASLDLQGRIIVVDCVTLWLTNFFADTRGDPEAALRFTIEQFDRSVDPHRGNTWLFVSNELGQGVHASTQAGRQFVDAQGWLNQHIAARADHVVLMVAGLPLDVKGRAEGLVASLQEPA